MSSDSGDEGGHEAAAAPAAAAPSKRGSKAAKQMSAKLLVEGIMDVVGTVLGACLNPDQVGCAAGGGRRAAARRRCAARRSGLPGGSGPRGPAAKRPRGSPASPPPAQPQPPPPHAAQVDKALDKAKKSPAFKHLISDLSSGAIALGGKGKGKGGGGGGGAPAGPKAIRHTYQAFTTVAMAALKEANRADLANMTTVGAGGGGGARDGAAGGAAQEKGASDCWLLAPHRNPRPVRSALPTLFPDKLQPCAAIPPPPRSATPGSACPPTSARAWRSA
jgi:hypothetical protein